MPRHSPSDVSVLIVSWNSAEQLASCLTSLRPLEYETIVVDNASEDGSADLVRQQYSGVTLLAQPRNLGFAGAINLAARTSSGRLLLFLNPDIEATPGAVELLRSSIMDNPAVAAAAGVLVDGSGAPQRGFNVRRFPTLGTWIVTLLLVDKIWPSNPISRRYLCLDLDYTKTTDVEQPAGACLMVRRDSFEQIGGMDEGFYPAWFEDVDFCRRLRERGWRIVLCPEALFRHRGGFAMRRLGLAAFSNIWYRNMERYVAKDARRSGGSGVARILTLKTLIAVGMLERLAISALRRDASSLGAYASVLRRTLCSWPRADSDRPSS